MHFCDEGIVLRQRPFRDNDLITTIFTRKNGRLEVIFKSVKKPKAKLRGISETFTYSDYRFYFARNSNFPVCTGGKTISVFNKIRSSGEKLVSAFYLSELIISLTPLSQPSTDKFELLLNAFNYLENSLCISKLFYVAYALILLEYCGIGFKKANPGINSRIWDKFHNPFFTELDDIEKHITASDFSMVAELSLGKIKEHTAKDINTLKFVKIL